MKQNVTKMLLDFGQTTKVPNKDKVYNRHKHGRADKLHGLFTQNKYSRVMCLNTGALGRQIH